MLEYRAIFRLLGKYFIGFSLLLLLPLGAALFFQEDSLQTIDAFVWTLGLTLGVSAIFYSLGKSASSDAIGRRESIVFVIAIWIFSALLAACPFYFSNTLTNPIDAYFEAMSGLTTTGATVLSPKAYDPKTSLETSIYCTSPHVPTATYCFRGTVAPIRDEEGLILHSGIEAVAKPILLWRSFLQWIGGMGIVLICLTLLPTLGAQGKFLYQVESTGPIKEGLFPRAKETASYLWKVYLALTLLEIVLLWATNPNVGWFDAICISFSNISTGGFSVKNQSIASYESSITEGIVLLFMILGSLHFAIYFHLIKRQFFKISMPDFFLFLAIVVVGSLIVSASLVQESWAGLQGAQESYSWKEAFFQGSFQAVSAQTSTGFITANYEKWPFIAQMFLLLLMFVGGMSGSTSGGIKTSRFYILYKIVLHRLESLYRPDSIRKLKIGSAEIDDKNALTVLSFFCIIAFFVVLGVIFFVFDGIDPETSLGLMACMMNNVGLAFRAAGPMESLAFLSNTSKLLSTFWMLLGRLEFYIVLLLFLPSFWKNR